MYPRSSNCVLARITFGLLVAMSGLVSSAVAQPEIEKAFPNLSFGAVTDIQAAPDGSNRLFVLERTGRIRVFEANSTTSETDTFLDVQSRVDTQGEGGLLGLAFHPNYEQNGRFFVYYTTSEDGPFRSVVSRFTVSGSDPNAADLGTEETILSVDQPYSNHNAGQLQFGPDGYLYVGLGDGGGSGDPEENGQDPTTLLGSMLRLDVDLDGSGTSPDCGSGAYEVPESNPFVGAASDSCDEIYAYGFRNPYRYSFGPEGRLWVADVGQSSWEEIDWVASGNNYGWDVMEGTHCYEPSSGCDTSGLTLPIFEYSHSVGNSITGGYVANGGCGYVEGRYVYGDYGSGRIWALSYDADGAVSSELLVESSLSLTTFGVGPNERLYFAGIFDDSVYQFACSALPVELATFNGAIEGSAVHLSWQTTSETNSAGFEVQRKAEGSSASGSWQKVGFRETKAPGGTTSEAQTYRFTDEDLPYAADTLEYRLRQVDTDGSATLSEPVRIARGAASELQLKETYPNPAHRQVTVQYAVPEKAAEGEAALRLYDVLGRRVRNVRAEATGGRHETQLSVEGLASGIYVLRLTAGPEAETRRLTVVR
jgi:hypothetical protein